ncbi:MAG: hypothetical protein R3311_21660, partial [Oceanisphaera sp.]|nr:hypothetical protein [Oceanisphaera sp.]
LPETDPYDRQLTIGLGCFLEQMTIAASARGYRVDTVLFPEGSDQARLGKRPVARCTFTATSQPTDPLFLQIPHRRSNKVPFDMERPVSAPDLNTVVPGVPGVRFDGTVETERVARLRELTWKAWLVEYHTPAALQESIDLMRLGKAEINANPDGIDLGGMPLEALIATGLLTREALATPGSQSYDTGISMYEPMLASTPAFVWLATPDNARTTQIATGRAWLRLNLLTTQQGLSLHPVSQCLQEYPEMAEHYQTVHQSLARPGETIQMLGRLGYAASAPKTPRWSLDDKIIRT